MIHLLRPLQRFGAGDPRSDLLVWFKHKSDIPWVLWDTISRLQFLHGVGFAKTSVKSFEHLQALSGGG
jgi:hypothetical protein